MMLLAFTFSITMLVANGGLEAPEWNSEGPVPFRQYYTELMAWLAITGPKYPPSAQAGALQMAMQGTARRLVFRIPPQYIQLGAIINGRRTDPVTYILYVLGNRFEQTEQERTITDAFALDRLFPHRGERIDSFLARWDMARDTAERVGAGTENFFQLSVKLCQKLGVPAASLRDLLKDSGNDFPRDEGQYDAFVGRLRTHLHFVEHFPGSIQDALRTRDRSDTQPRNRRYGRRSGHLAEAEEQDTFMTGEDDPWAENPDSTTPYPDSRVEAPSSGSWWDDQSSSYTADGSQTVDDADISATDTETISSLAEEDYDFKDLKDLTEE